MTTDWKALCKELAAIVAEDYGHTKEYRDGRPLDVSEVSGLLMRTRAALAQPEPEGPTDDDLLHIFYLHCDSNDSSLDVEHWLHEQEFLVAARAVLARWGQRAPQPIPVSERLPGAKDCDAQGRCWWAANDGIYHHWRKLDLEKALNSPWRPTHWLPAHALPLPQEPEGP